jgi:hypothetical protein
MMSDFVSFIYRPRNLELGVFPPNKMCVRIVTGPVVLGSTHDVERSRKHASQETVSARALVLQARFTNFRLPPRNMGISSFVC